MKILSVTEMVFPEVKVIEYARFRDERGFFAETYKRSDFQNNPALVFLKGFQAVQSNISYSKKNVIRGLHFQWDPLLSKLIRTIKGTMVDLFMDIRVASPTFGKISGWNMASGLENDTNQLIWVPAGFAHGGLFLEDTIIEYYCDSEWNPQGEASISPFAPDIDWSLSPEIKAEFDKAVVDGLIISQKDKEGYTIAEWRKKPEAVKFTY